MHSDKGLIIVNDFITPDEELALLQFIGTSDRKVGSANRNSIKRYGNKTPYNSHFTSVDIPGLYGQLVDRIFESGLVSVKYNSISVNEYFKGQAIIAHIDNDKSGDAISIISLKNPAVMRFTKNNAKFDIDMLPRQLVIMRDEIRWEWKHAILPVPDLRYSIVFRHGVDKKPHIDRKSRRTS